MGWCFFVTSYCCDISGVTCIGCTKHVMKVKTLCVTQWWQEGIFISLRRAKCQRTEGISSLRSHYKRRPAFGICFIGTRNGNAERGRGLMKRVERITLSVFFTHLLQHSKVMFGAILLPPSQIFLKLYRAVRNNLKKSSLLVIEHGLTPFLDFQICWASAWDPIFQGPVCQKSIRDNRPTEAFW